MKAKPEAKPEAKLEAKPEDMFMQAWKAQLDAGLRVLETITEGAIRMHEAQLEAATEAHADADATRKAILAATDASQLMKLYAEWSHANAEKSLAYWRSLFETVMQTDAAVAKCVGSGLPVALPEVFKTAELDASKQTMLGLIDGAYRQWLDAAQRMYRPVEGPRA
jgi:phasin family protein